MELQRIDSELFAIRGNALEAEAMRAAMTQLAEQGPWEDEPRARAHEQLQGSMPAVADPWEAQFNTLELVALQRAVRLMQHKLCFGADLRYRAKVLTQEFLEQGRIPENSIYFSE